MSRDTDTTIGLVGNEPAIAGSSRRAPDRREVSLRWLSGTFLTGVTSVTLMGAALFAALDGKQLLATPPEIASLDQRSDPGDTEKTTRLVTAAMMAPPPDSDRRRMSVSTVTRVDGADVVRTRPFEHLSIALAAAHAAPADYPAFNPLAIFAESSDGEAPATAPLSSRIYGADVETEAAIRITEMVFDDIADAPADLEISDWEAEEAVREQANVLTVGTIEVASLEYVDPRRFGVSDPLLQDIATTGQVAARIIPQNVSVSLADEDEPAPFYSEDLIEITAPTELTAIMDSTGYRGSMAMAEALETLLNSQTMQPGRIIRLGLETIEADLAPRIMRATLYNGGDHVLTISVNDRDQFVPAPEPIDPGVMVHHGASDDPVIAAAQNLPTVYDAIYTGVMAYDLPQAVAARIVRMVASSVDFRSQVTANDTLELFTSVPEENTDQAQDVLFVRASFSGQTNTFYKFRSADGTYDYFDHEGRSARQFLLRNPVPNGQFRSGYGMRRHPILGYSRMHWGADWAAPRGTPIIAPGDGTITEAGWNSGYGKQTVIRHANGYETSYSHQTRFADGMGPGTRVRQGQVIGYVGSTGLSTGPHLHYEMKVNGKHVDPMRVRLPDSRALEGEELIAFKRERDRINALLGIETDDLTEVADASG